MQNKKILFWKITTLLILLIVFSLPAKLSAIGLPDNSSGLVPCGGPTNPCTLCHLVIGFHNLVQRGLYWVVTFALVGIFISGVMYIISSGNEGMITKAKGFMKASLIGFVVVAGAWMIVNTTLVVLSAKDSNGDGNSDFGIASSGSWFNFTCNTTSNAGVVSPIAPGGAPSASPAPVRVGDPCTGIAPVGNRSGTCQSLTGTGGSASTARVCPNRSWSLQQITSEPRQCSSASLGCCDMSAANTNTAPGILSAPCGTGKAGTCMKVTGTFVLPSAACASLTPQKVPVSGGTPPFDSCLPGLWCCAAPSGGPVSPGPDITP